MVPSEVSALGRRGVVPSSNPALPGPATLPAAEVGGRGEEASCDSREVSLSSSGVTWSQGVEARACEDRVQHGAGAVAQVAWNILAMGEELT